MGVTVLESLNLAHHRTINLWLSQGQSIHVNYPNQTENILLNTLASFEARKIESEKIDLQLEKTILEKLSVLKYLF
jgi:hypothetical protein